VLCSSPDGDAHAQNPKPFTGGSDARDEMFVQQTDIDGLAQPLVP
jgi:hypothetical protein